MLKPRRSVSHVGLLIVAAVVTVTLAGETGAWSQPVPSGAPRWFVGKPETIRSAGSDTTLFLMQTLGNYFMQSALFGCALSKTPAPDYSSCNTATGDGPTTDLTDNYDRIEVMTGVDQVGSNEGQKQLCGLDSSPFPVDWARMTTAASASNGCSDVIELGFAKDGVVGVDFPGIEGPGTAAGTAFGSQVVGPVAAGWLPGDPVTCDTGAANSSTNALNRTSNPNVGILADSCSGVPFENVSNNDGGSTGSTAYRLWCATDSTRITDWGQLTNITGTTPVGGGTPIGIPITIIGEPISSGTQTTWATFANSSSPSGPCSGTGGNADVNASTLGGNQHIALQNNAEQLGQFARADFPSSDGTQTADQAAEIATSLYYMSNGVYNSDVHAREGVLSNGTQYAGNKLLANDIVPTTTLAGTLMTNSFPMAKTLYNTYRASTVRASVADYLDWICDSNSAFTKGEDLYTGKNYDVEVTTAINTTYGFVRLTDTTAPPNNSCQLITSVADPSS